MDGGILALRMGMTRSSAHAVRQPPGGPPSALISARIGASIPKHQTVPDRGHPCMMPHLRAKSGSIAALGPEARNELKARQLQRSAEATLQKPQRDAVPRQHH
eukprot:3897100-Pyramimonas_sp.AAC.1